MMLTECWWCLRPVPAYSEASPQFCNECEAFYDRAD